MVNIPVLLVGQLGEEVGMNMKRPKNLKAAEQQRSNISYEMDEKGHREYSEQKLKEEQEEKLRLERLANYERKAFNIYDKVHQRMIG